MCNEMPPEHTLIIEGNITSSIRSTNRQRINRHLRNRIITSCRDAHVMMGSKHIDLALCLYIGAYLICIDNKHLTDKVPRMEQYAEFRASSWKKMHKVTNVKITMGRKYGQLVQLMLSGLNVNMSTKQVSFYNWKHNKWIETSTGFATKWSPIRKKDNQIQPWWPKQ